MGDKPTILVIGAGIGGIAAAARLAKGGCCVTVVEKNDRPGGRCDRLVKDGHHFDTGPTLFLMPEMFEQTFRDLGECMHDHLDLRRIDPTYRLHFADGKMLSLSSDLNVMQAQLEAIEPGSFDGYLRYLNEGYHNYKLAISNLVQRDFRNPLEFFTLSNLILLFRLKALKKHYDNLGHYFRDPQLRAAFTFQDMYVGLCPFEAPAIFSLLQYSELANGVWFPMGGMYRIIQVLVEIARKWGVHFIYNSPVKQINVQHREATGVTLADGRRMQADIVVANADLPYVYNNLLPHKQPINRFMKKKFTCSTLMFYWGIDKQYPELGAHTLFFGRDYQSSFKYILEDFTLPKDPSFYVHAPVRVDPSLAPGGHDTLTTVVPVGHLDNAAPQNWPSIKNRARRAILARLTESGMSDFEQHIKFEVCYAPQNWQARYNLVKGATHGLSHNLLQMGYLRPRNRHARYQNLFFVGASTHPGTGLPTVLVSARHVSERVQEYVGISHTALAMGPSPIAQRR